MDRRYETTAAYISGAICGHTWMPRAMGGILFKSGNIRREMARGDRATFAELADLVLCERGGDFQDAAFTEDTVIRIERRAIDGVGKYRVHVKEISMAKVAPDYIHADCYVGDFMGDYD